MDTRSGYDHLVENLPVAVFVNRGDRVTMANAACARLFGADAGEQLIGRHVLELFHPEEHEAIRQRIERVRAGGRPSALTPARILRLDGRVMHVEATGSALSDEAGTAIQMVLLDATERHRYEDALRTARDHFQALIAASPAAIISVDPDGLVTFWSPGAEALFGWSASETVGAPLPFIPIDHEGKAGERRSHFANGQPADGVELTLTGKDGRPVHVILSAAPLQAPDGSPAGSIGVMTDITARKEAEAESTRRGLRLERIAIDNLATLERLRLSEERYRSLVENLDDIVYAIDLEGRITYVSGGVARFGYAPGELMGQRFLDFTHPDDRARVRDGFAARIAEDQEPIEYRVLDRNGKVRFVRSASRRTMVDGKVAGLLGILFDVSVQRQTEDALRMAQKMEAVGRLAGGVAHDFNNILTVISSYAGLALRGLRAEDPLRRDLEEIRKASDRATALTRQLLAFSRRQVLQPSVLDLNQLLEGVEKMLRRLIGEDVDLRVSPAPDLGRIRADPGQVEQVVMNLVVNARDAMPEGGALTLLTEDVELDDEFVLHHAGARSGPHVMLAVSDTGCGMDASVLERLFDPFFTTKPAGKGTGLGLATVYGIVSQSGGGIWAESAPGKGSTFRVYFPRVDAEVGAQPAAPRVKRPPVGAATILLVEDDASLRHLAERILSAAGHTVLPAANGGEALLLCERHGPALTLLLADVVMPGMSGRELASRIGQLAPNARILFMSGYTDDAILHHGVLEPGTFFLPKPFTAESLLSRVEEVLAPRG